jgi:response regulator RpfG family c-di-GMP phosphodiesterase
MKVLYIDDSPLQIKLMGIFLKNNPKLELVPAQSGKEGIQKAQNEPTDIILLDMEMPEMDGEAVLKALKQNHLTSDIPVIMFTSSDEQGLEEKLAGLGAAAFLKKPHGIQMLNNTINSVINRAN